MFSETMMKFDKAVCEYPFKQLDELEFAYAVTIHINHREVNIRLL